MTTFIHSEEVNAETPTPWRPPRHFVGVRIELTACVKLGHVTSAAERPLLVNTDGNSDRYLDRAAAVCVQDDVYTVGVAASLVDRVVDNLVDQVVKSVPSSVSPMYMPGTLTNSVASFETWILSRCTRNSP